ncbi:putative membrane protein [Helianthus anomalus]
MFDVDNISSRQRKPGPIANAPLRTGLFGNSSNSNQTSSNSGNRMGSLGAGPGSSSMKKASSDPLNKHGEPIRKSSGPQSGGMPSSRNNSGPQSGVTPVLPTTGLITSRPLNSSGQLRRRSGSTNATGPGKSQTAKVKNQAVTHLRQEDGRSFSRLLYKPLLWGFLGPFGRGRYINVLPEVNISQWRKGSQWFETNQKLAIDIIKDTKIYPKFNQFCSPACYVDEHYFPTMQTIKSPSLLYLLRN